ncbi:MAG: methionyl-tRNA formyltransferase [Halomonadaceae bacterium]|nr:MAG: methionyl-tRNA formyltransferase [Halomonadaceae bacterium]
MRIVFAGTPEFAATALQALLAAGHDIVAVYSQPDRPAGRGRKAKPGPVTQAALDAGLPVEQPLSLKDPQAQATLAGYRADVMIVAAYGLLLPQAVLDLPRHGCLNIHASLLPRWRGAAPIQRAIAAGDRETGITIMQMDKGLDTGAMLLKQTTPIAATDTGGSLHDRLAVMGGEAINAALAQLAAGTLTPEPQDDSQACYAHKLNKHDGALDWQQPATTLARQVRAFNPWPVCYADQGETRIRILAATPLPAMAAALRPGQVLERHRDGIDVACGDGVLRLTRLQLPGKQPQTPQDLINGGRPLLQTGSELNLL